MNKKQQARWSEEEVTAEFVAHKFKLWKNDFWQWFVDCVYTIDEADIDTPIKLATPFKYLKIFHETIQENDVTVVVKSRQLFFTWFVAARFLHNFLFRPYSRSVFMSQRQTQVEDVIKNRIVAIYENLPKGFPWPELKDREHIKNLSLTHPSQKIRSLVIGLPSGPNQARGMTGTELWLDELGFQEYQELTLKTIRPLVKKEKTKLIITSTPNPGTHYEELCKSVAENNIEEKMTGVWKHHNEQGDCVLSVRYDAHPEQRSKEWAEQKKKEVGDLTWRVEYNLEWTLPAGKPVFPEFNKEQYCVPYTKHGTFTRDFPLDVGLDFGGHYPAAVFGQKDSLGRHLVHKAVMAEDEELADFLIRVEDIIREEFKATEFRLFCDPAGGSVNLQGTAPPASVLVENHFKKPVHYIHSHPYDRIRAIKMLMNKKKGETMGIIFAPDLGQFIAKDGTVRNGIMIEGLEHGYVYDKGKNQLHYTKVNPKKDGFFEHPFDAWGYMFILVFPALMQMIDRVEKQPRSNVRYPRKRPYLRK